MNFLEDARTAPPLAHVAGFINDARQAFAKVRPPTRKDEDWRLLKLKPLFSATYGLTSGPTIPSKLELSESATCHLHLENGKVCLPSSNLAGLEKGVFVGSLEDAPSYVFEALEKKEASPFEDEYFDLLNRSSLQDIACIFVEKNILQPIPLHVSYGTFGDAFSSSPRLLILVEEGAQITVIETWEGEGAYFNLSSTECAVGKNAKLKHIRLQQDDSKATHISRLWASVDRDASYDSLSLSFGALLSRNDVFISHVGEGSFSRIDGLALLQANQVSDTHSTIDNCSPHCESHQLHKCVVNDSAHAIFNGRILVQQDAQRIDAYQLNRNLLLSDKAKINTKPQLEILADDVRCSHGATVGQLDKEQLFYLESRGLSHDEARSLLTYAFAAEVVSTIEIASLKQHIEDHIKKVIDKNI